MLRTLTYVVAVMIVVPTGIAAGLWTGRWVPAESFDVRIAALRDIPRAIGPWVGRDIEPEAKTWERAGVAGGLIRRYEAPDGSAVVIMLVCGRPGPTSVHTPEVCYSGAGYEPATERAVVTLTRPPGADDGLWTSDFLKQDSATPEYLRIFHAWSTDGRWRAPSNPRMEFGGSRALYKLYIVRQMPRIEGPPEGDPSLAFARLFLPEVEKALRPGG